MRRMGDSVDWSREYFTMDEKLSKTVVTETFVKLYEQGLIYRGKRLVNWDPVLMSAVRPGGGKRGGRRLPVAHPYPLADGSGHLTVATTRPETMLGDVAVMVHPEDERYTHLIGQTVRLPLCDRDHPGDCRRLRGQGLRHRRGQGHAGARRQRLRGGPAPQLPMIGVLTWTPRSTTTRPAAYRGLDRFVARKQVVADLEALGLLVETKKHKLMVPRCARTGQVIEPMLTDQWFVAMTKVATRTRPAKASRRKPSTPWQRPGALRARELGQHLQPVDEQHPGLVHQPPALVGPPDSGLVRRGRPGLCGPQRSRGQAPRRAPATPAR
jgi:valyl-tRNA synthetase